MLINQLNGIKKAEKFLWDEEIEHDFNELKKAFTKGGIQAFPDFGVQDPFILTTDWRKENIIGVLFQVQDGPERFLKCWGRKVTNTREIMLVVKENCYCDPVYQEVETHIKLSPI